MINQEAESLSQPIEQNEAALRLAYNIIARSPAVAFVWQNAPGWPVEFASENAAHIFGWTAQDFVAGQVAYTSVVYPADLDRVSAEVARSSADLTARVIGHTPYRIIRKDGQIRWVEDMTYIRRTEEGEIVAYESILLDITARRLAEEKIEHLNRVLLAIRNVNQLIVRERDRDRLIQGACDHLVETHGYFNAWIALYDEAGRPAASAEAGLGDEFLPIVDQLKRGELTICGQRSLAQAGVVAIQDPITVCGDCPLAANYAGRGAMAVRLEHGGTVYGLLAVSIPAHLTVDEEEQGLLLEVANDLGFALHKIEAEVQLHRLRHITTTIPQPMSFVGRDYRYLAVNDAYAELYGAAPGQIVGHTVADFCGQALFEAEIKPQLDRCLAGEGVHYEVQVDFPGRGRRWMAMGYYPYCDERGEIRGVVSHGLDITERKQAEDALRESEARYRSLAENFPNGALFLFDQDFRYLAADGEALSRAGLTGDQIVGRTVAEVFPELVDIVQPHAEAALQGREGYYEVEYKGRTYSNQALPIRSSTGLRGQALVVTQDITERKQAEAALRDSEELFRTVFEQSAVGIAQVMPDGRFTRVNARFCDIVGYTQDEISGLTFRDITHPDDLHLDHDYIARVMVGEIDSFEIEKRYVHKDGHPVWIRLYSNVVRNEDGGMKYAIATVADITERKQAEQALRESEQRYRRLVESIQDSVYVLNKEWRHIVVNDAAERFTQIPRDRLLGAKLTDLFPGIETTPFFAAFRRVMESRNPEVVATEYTFANGRQGWYEVHIYPAPEGILCISRDITERKRAEEALRESEKRFRDVVSSLPGAVYQLVRRSNGAFETRFMSEGAGSLFNRPLEELWDSARLFDDLHPADVPGMWSSIEESAQTLTPWRREFRLVPRVGEPKWLRGVSSPRVLSSGDICWTGVVLDVTERKRAEQALQESERQKELILNATAEMIAYYDPDLRVVWANRASAESVGRSPQELIGLPCYEIWHQRHDPCPDCPVLKARDDKAPRQGEQQSPDGRYWFLRGYPVFDEGDNVIGLVEFGQDITERKQAEADKSRLEEQFHQAQKLEAVGRLAGGVAHDFNNILTVILGHTAMAMEGLEPAQPLFADLEQIRQAAERSANLTRQLLAFARKQTITPQVLDLNETIEGMLKMLRRLIGENIDLAWLPRTGLWPVKVDPSQVDQILANLCINARDAIDGVGKITIETDLVVFDEAYCHSHAGVTPGEFVLLAVSDNGCGMDRATLANIFEPFFTTKGPDQGTGLGLATVYGIVKQNSGFINVYSEPGQGATFKIYLPPHTPRTGSAPPESPAHSPAARGHETILLVEDEPMVLNLGQRMLESFGYRVLAAATPGEAIRLAEEHAGEIHLVVTDVVMPEMNGRELLKSLLSFYPDLRHLFMSGYTANVIAHQGVLEEGVNFIQKPFTIQALAASVRQVLDSK